RYLAHGLPLTVPHAGCTLMMILAIITFLGGGRAARARHPPDRLRHAGRVGDDQPGDLLQHSIHSAARCWPGLPIWPRGTTVPLIRVRHCWAIMLSRISVSLLI